MDCYPWVSDDTFIGYEIHAQSSQYHRDERQGERKSFFVENSSFREFLVSKTFPRFQKVCAAKVKRPTGRTTFSKILSKPSLFQEF